VEIKTRVSVSRFAEKQIDRLPVHIYRAYYFWISAIENKGLFEVRKISAYHDEPLKGKRLGQRSVRLNRSYRIIYVEIDGTVDIQIIEVNKHDY
jgi:toxin HigB-1